MFLEESTAVDSLHGFFDLGALVPLWRTTAYGRSFVDFELCFALFVLAGAIALWVDRPGREHRSIAEILAGIGVVAAAAAVLVVPGAAGHAAQTSPRGLAVALDWLHVGAGSLWLGGLAGLIVLWATLPSGRRLAGLGTVAPRFSNLAFVSVLVLLGSGIWAAVLHLPIWSALWTTSYGQTILVKAGLLAGAMLLGAVNLLYTRPRLAAAGDPSAPSLLLGVVSGRAPARRRGGGGRRRPHEPGAPLQVPRQGGVGARQGRPREGRRRRAEGRVYAEGARRPNKAAAPNRFALQITKDGRPVTGANVTATFAMLDMEMGSQEYQLTEGAPGVYSRLAPALVMVGHWGLTFDVAPKSGPPFTAVVVDRATG